MSTGGQVEAATEAAIRRSVVDVHQVALERSDLWKLHRAILAGAAHHELLTLSREANAEFIRNRMPHQIAG